MEEILKKLLESEVLSEETKTDLTEAWQEAVAAKKAELKEEAALEVRAELAEQWIKERDILIDKIDTFVSEQLAQEIEELRADIERFRDLEAEYAGKIVEEKQKLSESLSVQLDELVDKIDSFFEVRLAEELEELKDDLEVAKQNDFGRKIFEAFVSEYTKSYVDEDSIHAKLNIAESKLEDAAKRLSEVEQEKAQLLREQKMEEILKPLSGSKKEQMALVLKNIETHKLDEAYNYFIGRIIKEDTSSDKLFETKTTVSTTIVTGEEESEEESKLTEAKETRSSDLFALKRLAGIS